MINTFLDDCRRVLKNDPATVDRLRQCGFECHPAEWRFTLPQIFQLLYTKSWEQNLPEYKAFRKNLFESDFNHQLSILGAEIAIADNQGKVDKNLYRLRLKPNQSMPR